MNIFNSFVCIVIGYLIGCLQSAYFIGKIFGNLDIREHGSGNAGTTNTVRILGRRAGASVFVLDVLKGILAYTVCAVIFNGGGTFFSENFLHILPGLIGGFGVILGHAFPFYLNFKGGKGVACMLGIILSVNFVFTCFLFSIGIVLISITKYMSVASIGIAVFLPIAVFNFGFDIYSVFVSFCISFILIYLHKDNIKRIISGTERKFSLKKHKEEIK